jgi:hypothetical protein
VIPAPILFSSLPANGVQQSVAVLFPPLKNNRDYRHPVDHFRIGGLWTIALFLPWQQTLRMSKVKGLNEMSAASVKIKFLVLSIKLSSMLSKDGCCPEPEGELRFG